MITQITKTHAICPSCGAVAGQVDHLLGQDTTTRWYCDTCGEQYRLAFHADRSVDITPAPERLIQTYDLLVLKPQDKPVYFILKGMRFEAAGEPIRDENDSKQFFYESHSCPTNWLKPEMMYYDGDADPHGVIEFVAFRDVSSFPPDEDWGPNTHDLALQAFIEESSLAKTEGS